MHRENALNRERILRTAPSPDGPGRVVLVEALLTEDEVESIHCILSALARRQHPRGEQIYKARLTTASAILRNSTEIEEAAAVVPGQSHS